MHNVMKSGMYGGGLLASYPGLQELAPDWCGFAKFHEANMGLRLYFEVKFLHSCTGWLTKSVDFVGIGCEVQEKCKIQRRPEQFH
jgi:hypothetical protein